MLNKICCDLVPADPGNFAASGSSAPFHASGSPMVGQPMGHQPPTVIGPNGYIYTTCPSCGEHMMVVQGFSRIFTCGYGASATCSRVFPYVPPIVSAPPVGTYSIKVEVPEDPIPTVCKCNLWGGCKCGVFKREMEEKRKKERQW